MNNTKSAVLSGLVWRFAERCGAQGIQFIVSIVLARLLTPEDYGLIGLITVFIAIAMVFTHSGLGIGIVQKKDADELDFSTVFIFSFIFSVILYLILFFAAPYIAGFYDEPRLIPIVRALSITVIIGGGINGIQLTYIQKTMQFKKFFWSTIIGTIISAFVGIGMAVSGMGVWSLVGQTLTNQCIDTLVLRIMIRKTPKLRFSFERLKVLFSFGWKMLISVLVDTIYVNFYSLIIGKFFSKTELGYYTRGRQFPYLIINNLTTTIDSVLFPALTQAQDNLARLKAMTRRAIVTSTYIIFPALAGLAVISTPLVKVLLTDKWLPAVPFIQFNCFILALQPVQTANLQAIKALGRSDIYLKIEILKKLFGVTILVSTIHLGLYNMMFGQCVVAVINSIVNIAPNKNLLNYSYKEQATDILPSIAMSLFMAFVIYLITMLPILPILQLVIQIVLGVAVYIGLSKLFKIECYTYVTKTVKEILIKKKNRSEE